MLTELLEGQLVDTAPFPRGGLNSPRPVSLACEAQVFHSHAYLCLSFFFNVCCWCLLSTVSYVQQKLGQCNHLSHNAYCELLAHGNKLQQLRNIWKHFKQINYQQNFFPLPTRCEWPQRYHCCWFGHTSNFHQIDKLSSEESVSCRDKVCSETCALVSWMDSAHTWVAHILQEPHWEFKRAILSSLSMMF